MKTRFFGQYLLARGLITPPQLLAAIEYQQGTNSRLGEHAVALGMVTPFEADQINAFQAKHDSLFGEAAVEMGLMSGEQVDVLVASQESRHLHLGQALLSLGYLERSALDQALSAFLSREAELEPEVVTIPEELPNRDVAFELFYLTHKLLLRVWGLDNKTDRLRMEAGTFTLSDRNARVFCAGALQSEIIVGVPHAVAEQAARRFAGEDGPLDGDVNGIVRQFANIVAENLVSVLAERGRRVTVEPAHLVDSRSTLPPEQAMAVVPYLTHLGQVLVGLRV